MRGGGRVELFLDVCAVGFDRLRAEVQASGDILGGDALADELEDLEFPRTERVGAGLLVFRTVGKKLEQLPGDGLAHIDAAAQDGMNRLEHLVAVLALHDVASRADLQRPPGVAGLSVHRENEHRNPGAAGVKILHQLEAAPAGQGNIGEHQIGLQVYGGIQRLACIPRLATHLQAGLAGNHHFQAHAGHGMVLDEQDTLFLRLLALWRGLRFFHLGK